MSRVISIGLLAVILLLCASPGWADTRTGQANRTTQQLWRFFNFGRGEAKVTLSWTKANANLVMVLVCGVTDPQTFGIAAAGLNRYAEITAGVPASTTCLVGVSAATIPSAYRIHFNQTVSEISTPAGRQRFARPTDDAPSVDALSWYARHELDRVRAKLGQ